MASGADPRGYTNETLGQSVEKVLCDLAGLDASAFAHRSRTEFEQAMRPVMVAAASKLPTLERHVGAMPGARGGVSKSPFDFKLKGGASLSVKTNLKKSSGKACPPDVGQPGMPVYKQFFGHLYATDDLDTQGMVTVKAFKRVAQERIADKMKIYLDHLFDCDFLLWAWLAPQPGYAIFRRSDLPIVTWDERRFSFSQTPTTWNESCSIRYRFTDRRTGLERSLPIGEFQIHNHRSNFKFRAHLGNLRLLFDAIG